MTETHRRWLCGLCQREWLYAHMLRDDPNGEPWTPDQGCPRCHSMDIALHSYTPEFYGGDLIRDHLSAPIAPIEEAPVVPPVRERQNLTLVMASSPELDR